MTVSLLILFCIHIM